MGRIFNFSGIYTSYSISSGSRSLKIEPYLIAPSESGNYVEVGHNNAYGVTHWSTALMNGFNHLYLMFNEKPFAPAFFVLYLLETPDVRPSSFFAWAIPVLRL